MLTFKSLDFTTAVVLLSIVSGTPILRLDSCSNSEVTFTCTVIKLYNGEATLQWVIRRLNMEVYREAIYLSSDDIGFRLHIDDIPYQFNLTSQSPLTSTLTANTSDLRGATVSCHDIIDSHEPAHMAIIAVHEPPSPHNITMTVTLELDLIAISLSVYLHWSVIAQSDVIENTSYLVTIIPELKESNTTYYTTTLASLQIPLLYNQEYIYDISVAARNCIGMSAPAEIQIAWNDQCPTVPSVWANVNFEFVYRIGSQPPYSCLSTPLPDSVVRNCTSSDDWSPNPADTACSYEGHTHDAVITTVNEQDSHGIIIISTTVVVLVFLVVLTLTTVLFITVWLHRWKQDSRSETQTEEQTQNEYTEVGYLQEYQDDNETGSHDHMEQNHNLTEGHSTFTLISELQNPLYQNVAEDHPDASLNIDSLLIQLRVQVTPKWYQFGLAIGMPEDLLDQYSSYPADERLIEVLDFWFKSHQNPTWRDVAKVLCDIELHELAEGIMNVYETGRLPVEVDADDSDSDDNILLPLPIPSNMLHSDH